MKRPEIRRARRADVADIVRLLADDALGSARERYETPLPRAYLQAFAAIDRDPNQELLVACVEGRIAGTLQLSFIPSLSRQGAWRAQIEAVRVDSSLRSRGLGRIMLQHAIARARTRGCRMVQLTTDRSRREARQFYEGLGFVASHHGMKLHLKA